MKKIFLLFSIFSILFISFSPTLAAIPNKAEGLTVSPPLKELDLEPGKVYSEQIKLNNPTDQTIEMYPAARNFGASGESGTPLIESPDADPTYGLAKWISFTQPKIVLTKDQEAVFNYTITVPLDAEPGGHYASVLFASQPPKPDEKITQVALASMVGSLILGKVAGAIVEKAEVREFNTNHLIYINSPANFTLRIANLGNIHIKPKGEIVVKNWGQSTATIDINPKKGNVLPNSIRRFDDLNYSPHWWSFGYFSAKFAATYGDTNQPLTANITFWIIPIWLIIAIILIILAIIFIFWRRRRRLNHIPPRRWNEGPAPQKKRIILQ